jgi:hypothetical protein
MSRTAESRPYSVIASGFVPLHADYRNGATLDGAEGRHGLTQATAVAAACAASMPYGECDRRAWDYGSAEVRGNVLRACAAIVANRCSISCASWWLRWAAK